jgi:kynurenine formamidase
VIKIIDLSSALEVNSGEVNPPKVRFLNHTEGAKIFCNMMADSNLSSTKDHLVLQPADFPNSEFLSNEFVDASVHSGTHLDAPWHFGSQCEGMPSKTIDQIPLEWCYGNGVVLDCTEKKQDGVILRYDIEQALIKINYSLQEGDIVLIHTGADRQWGTSEYFTNYTGMSYEATKFIIEQGIKLIGIDSYGFDPPFAQMIRNHRENKDAQCLWPAHFYGREKEYLHLERLTGLGSIPKPYGFKFACFPIKITGAGAAWVRAVAIFES